jgi:hypothetical protein
MNVEAEEITEEVRLDKYLSALWRGKWLILAAVLVSIAISAWAASAQRTLYTATALIEIGRVWKEPLQDHYTTREIINSAGFSEELARRAHLSPDLLKRGIRADVITAGPRRASYPILVRVVATAEQAEQSAQLARAVADEIISRHEELFRAALAPRLEQQRRLEERLSEAASSSAPRDDVTRLEAELVDLKARNSSPPLTQKTQIVNDIVAEGVARQPIWRKVLAAAVIAALVAAASMLLVEFLRPSERKSAAGRPG